MKFNLKDIAKGAVVAALLLPVAVFAARTATPLVSSLFPNSAVYVNMAAPSVFLPNATTTGSLGTNQTLYFQVTALDGQGESTGANVVGTTTAASVTEGLQLTWLPVIGAFGYKVYFSTSTPLTLTQYFAATSTAGIPNLYYTFTSTSSPVYAPGGQPTSNTAYGTLISGINNSYLLGGALSIGTSTFPTNVLFQLATSTATTTEEIGAKGASGGRIIMVDSNGSHTTCTEISTAAGVVAGKVVTCP